MRRRLLVLSLTILGLLWCAHPSSAQSEGIELKHSPNGRRALRQHEQKRADLVASFHDSNKLPAKRFEQACERHLVRYKSMLEREMRTLTRKGSIEEAKAIQSAVQRAEAWAITPPDREGMHFLSKENLEVTGSEKATKLGVDLLVAVESASELYSTQCNKNLDQYKGGVAAARTALKEALAQTLGLEQRAGRLDAVQELQKTLSAIKELPEVTRPELVADAAEKGGAADADGPVPKDLQATIPDSLVGFYSVRYYGADRMPREALIELRSDRGLLRAIYFYDRERKVQWAQSKKAIKVTTPVKDTMVLQFKEGDGREVAVKMTFLTRDDRIYINSGATVSYRTANGEVSGPERSSVRKLGYSSSTFKGLEDGVYTIEVDLSRNPEGGAAKGKKRFRLEVTSGSYSILQSTPINKLDSYQACVPTVFRASAQGADILMEAEYHLARPTEVFVLRSLREGKKEMQLWWDRTNYRNGQPADAFGTLTEDD